MAEVTWSAATSGLKGGEVRFHHAIVKLPCPEMIRGISRSSLGKPDYPKALEQHSEYVEALKMCGLSVMILEADDRFPDSTFIEDVALCTPACAIVTNPGALSRKGETDGIRQVLQEFYTDIEEIAIPGTLEAGDVMMVSNNFYIGLSERTNNAGISQLTGILRNYGFTASKVPLKQILHLKTGVSYIENNNFLVSGELIDHREFAGFNRIIVDRTEAYASNSVWINGRVLVPQGYPKTRHQIEEAGYETIILDVSEFRKLDGGLSCLSLRF
ncbi:MAG: arginine deiminase family protein [Bacteroidales bacterium]